MAKPDVRLKFYSGTADGPYIKASCALLSYRDSGAVVNIIIDVGLNASNAEGAMSANLALVANINAKHIDAIVITHAHCDHAASVPAIVSRGFGGRIFCTEHTGEILHQVFADSAKIQESICRMRNKSKAKNKQLVKVKSFKLDNDQRFLGSYDRVKNKYKAKRPELELPLYDQNDVLASCDLISPKVYGEWFKLCHKNIHIKFYQAGHVLGSAICVIRIQVGRDEFMYIGFGGDLGRDSILLNAPKLVTEKLDYWVSESTYGDRSHPSLADESEFMFDVLRQVMRVGLGRVIIPALALHRSQEMIVTLVKAMQSGEIPRIPIYLHSKLAAGITAIYSKDWERLNKKAGLDFNPFLNSSLRVLNSDQDAKALMRSKEPMILVSSSGMCNAGPVRSYLRHWLGDAKTIVFLVSYMAENTLGKRLQDGSRTVHIDKEIVEVRARICSFKAFSGHADSQALTNYAAALVNRHSERVMRIFINHGTSLSAKYLKEKMIEAKIAKDQDITIPSLGAEYALNIEYKN